MLRVVSVLSLPVCFTVLLFFTPPASVRMPERRASEGPPVGVLGEAKLHVDGTSWFQGDTTPLPPEAGQGIGVGYASAYGGGYIFGFDYATFMPRHLFLNHPGGNVGVGTLTPLAKLDVAGSGFITVIAAASTDGLGVYATTSNHYGVFGRSTVYEGVYGVSTDGIGVHGSSSANVGVYGNSDALVGSYGESPYIGVQGNTTSDSTDPDRQAVRGDNGGSATGWAGFFSGNVHVTGTLSKGGGSFKIDHPLDPENKYLAHSFVESPDMKNVYDGTVVLDARGEATVTLPQYFEALNRDFRYQLTCIGGFAPVYIAEEIMGNRFKIAGGQAGMKVSWQVTGIRHDAFAEQHRIPVEEMKPPEDRGRYLHPAAFGLPMDRAVEAARFRVEPPKTPPAAPHQN